MEIETTLLKDDLLDAAVTYATGGLLACIREEEGGPRYEAYSAEQSGVDGDSRYRVRLGWIGSIPLEWQEAGDKDMWRPTRDVTQGETLMKGRRLVLEEIRDNCWRATVNGLQQTPNHNAVRVVAEGEAPLEAVMRAIALAELGPIFKLSDEMGEALLSAA